MDGYNLQDHSQYKTYYSIPSSHGRHYDSYSLKASSSSNNTSADSYQTAAAELARVLRKMGWSECADGHPELLRAAQAGINPEALQAAAAKKAGKPISYVVPFAAGGTTDTLARSDLELNNTYGTMLALQ